jgi:hypothetical protein
LSSDSMFGQRVEERNVNLSPASMTRKQNNFFLLKLASEIKSTEMINS